MKNKVCAVVGAQFGSEGKGVVVAELANEYNCHVRTGGPNAGHTIAFQGNLYKMQALPCGWINRDALLYIGPGAVVDLGVLEREVEMTDRVMPGIRDRLMIDPRAGVLEPHHHAEEGGVEGEMHKRFGSTGEGVGACRHDRMRRNPASGFRQFEQVETFAGQKASTMTGTPDLSVWDVLLEGTQGFGLSLTHGSWPHVTSADTTAAQLCADAGIAPRVERVILVARTMPIRVAGPSGGLQGETNWADLSSRLGKEVLERTTVTKKVRRIGEWDEGLFRRAARVNGATEVALTFGDYMDPANYGATRWRDLTQPTQAFVERIEDAYEIPVTYIGTGFDDITGWSYVRRGA